MSATIRMSNEDAHELRRAVQGLKGFREILEGHNHGLLESVGLLIEPHIEAIERICEKVSSVPEEELAR